MGDEEQLLQLKEDIQQIKERLNAIEREQRLIIEDILSGNAKSRMQKRLLEKPTNKTEEIRRKIDKEFNIEI